MHINELGLYNSYGVWHIPFWYKPWFLYSIYVSVFIVGVVLLVYGIKKYRSTRLKSVIPCWQEALDALYQIEKQSFDGQNTVLFYDEITAVFKKYLSKRWNQDFCSATDEEVIDWCEKFPIALEQKVIINNIFSISSQSRFSRSCVSREQMKRDIEQCIIYVTQTTPHEQPR